MIFFQPESKNEKSPLQLLAQTCSQIGADNVSSKILSTTEKLKPKDDKKRGDVSPSINVSDSKPVSFKPYASDDKVRVNSPKTPSASSPHQLSAGRDGTKESSSKTSTPSSSCSGTSPVIQSGIEVLAGHAKDGGLGRLGSLDPSNPAFRPQGLPGYPSSMGHPGVCRDPFCRDPSCPTANYNAYLARLTTTGGLPPGYLELLEAYKMYAPGGMSSMPPTSLPSPTSASLGPGGPYICNWMNGREYCGKRYTNAEELLIHLKTHTSLSVSESHLASTPSLNPAVAAYSSLFAGAGAAASLRGPYPSALSLAASRYNPYGKPGYPSPLPPSLSGLGLPGGPPGLQHSLGGLSPYLSSLGAGAHNPLSLYSLYGARL